MTYTATPAEDYKFPEGAKTSWAFTNSFDVEECGEEPLPVSPTDVKSVDVCEPATGPTNDRIMIPTDASFIYQVDGKDVNPGAFVASGTSHTVKAIAKEGVAVIEGAKTEWTFTFTKVACVTTTETPSPTPTPTPTPPTETPTTPTDTPTPEIGTPTSTSVPTPTSTPTFVPPSTGGGEWPPAGFSSSDDYSMTSLLSKLSMLLGAGLLLGALFAPRRRKVTA